MMSLDNTNHQLSIDPLRAAVRKNLSAAIDAQVELEKQDEGTINHLLLKISDAVIKQAEILATINVEETGMGVVQDKINKIRFAGEDVYHHIKSQPAYGVIENCEATGITKIASPIGTIFGLVPATNPVSTLLFKTLIALKTRNAILYSCHRDTRETAKATLRIIHSVLTQLGLPNDLVSVIENPGKREIVREYMSSEGVAMILATGGPSMVKAAYESGTPAIGVGSGNAPVMVTHDANLNLVANALVSSKSFDNGIICGSENNIVVPIQQQKTLLAELVRAGAAILSASEISRLEILLFKEEGGLKREYIGKSAELIMDSAAIKRHYPVKLLILPIEAIDYNSPWLREKLAPILSLISVETEEHGYAVCKKILSAYGAGHTAVIHSSESNKIERFGLAMPASRILVNVPASQGCIGMVNHLTPSLTLGCGSWGGGSTTDNVNIEHLINIKRIAKPKKDLGFAAA